MTSSHKGTAKVIIGPWAGSQPGTVPGSAAESKAPPAPAAASPVAASRDPRAGAYEISAKPTPAVTPLVVHEPTAAVRDPQRAAQACTIHSSRDPWAILHEPHTDPPLRECIPPIYSSRDPLAAIHDPYPERPATRALRALPDHAAVRGIRRETELEGL